MIILDHCYPPRHLPFLFNTQYLIIGHEKTDEKATATAEV